MKTKTKYFIEVAVNEVKLTSQRITKADFKRTKRDLIEKIRELEGDEEMCASQFINRIERETLFITKYYFNFQTTDIILEVYECKQGFAFTTK